MFVTLSHWCIKTEPPLNFLRYLSSLSLSLEPRSCTSGLYVPLGHQLPRLQGGGISPDPSSLWSAAGKEPQHPSSYSWPAAPVYSDPQTFLNLPISLQPHCTLQVSKTFFISWQQWWHFHWSLLLILEPEWQITNDRCTLDCVICLLYILDGVPLLESHAVQFDSQSHMCYWNFI